MHKVDYNLTMKGMDESTFNDTFKKVFDNALSTCDKSDKWKVISLKEMVNRLIATHTAEKVEKYDIQSDYSDNYHSECPRCGLLMRVYSGLDNKAKWSNYCPHCGQYLDHQSN